MLSKLFTGARTCSLWVTWLGGTLIVLSAFLVTLEVFLRKVFNVSLGGADEISGYASGSSVATAATIGTVAVPQIKKRGYNERLFLGTVAAGGTLGILIPPSINLILYGLLTNTSVPELYLAGFLPGFLLALLFMVTVVVACILKPEWGGEQLRHTWAERFRALPALITPPIGINLYVVQGIRIGEPMIDVIRGAIRFVITMFVMLVLFLPSRNSLCGYRRWSIKARGPHNNTLV